MTESKEDLRVKSRVRRETANLGRPRKIRRVPKAAWTRRLRSGTKHDGPDSEFSVAKWAQIGPNWEKWGNLWVI